MSWGCEVVNFSARVFSVTFTKPKDDFLAVVYVVVSPRCNPLVTVVLDVEHELVVLRGNNNPFSVGVLLEIVCKLFDLLPQTHFIHVSFCVYMLRALSNRKMADMAKGVLSLRDRSTRHLQDESGVSNHHNLHDVN
jgi:hypothetical protein